MQKRETVFHKDPALTPTREYVALRFQIRNSQIQFITTELELALTFATLAQTYFSMNKHVQGKASFERAVRACESARVCFDTLIDPEEPDIERITALCVAAEAAVSALQSTVIRDLKMSA